MRIIIFRHGEKQDREESLDTETNRNVTLSIRGIKQIETLAKNLYVEFPEFIGIQYIYSSPLPRTIQSAEIVRRRLNIKEIKPLGMLKELYPTDDYSLPRAKRKEMHKYALENMEFINENGYSYSERITAILNLLKHLYDEGNKNVIISAHGGVIRALLSIIDRENSKTHLETRMSEGAYVLLDFNGDEFKINFTKDS